MRSQLGKIDGTFNEVRRQQEAFAKKLDEVIAAGHRDGLEIMRQMTALHERVAVVEAKQGR